MKVSHYQNCVYCFLFHLQSSFISMYIMYLTWSALVNIPEVECNPTLRKVNTTTMVDDKPVVVATADLNFGWQTAVSLSILIFSVVWSSFRVSLNSTVGRLTMAVSFFIIYANWCLFGDDHQWVGLESLPSLVRVFTPKRSFLRCHRPYRCGGVQA